VHTRVAFHKIIPLPEGQHGRQETRSRAGVANVQARAFRRNLPAQAAHRDAGFFRLEIDAETQVLQCVGKIKRIVRKKRVGERAETIRQGGDEQRAIGQGFRNGTRTRASSVFCRGTMSRIWVGISGVIGS
jgi:hypothetical protein